MRRKISPFLNVNAPDGKKYKFIKTAQAQTEKYFKTDKMCIEIGKFYFYIILHNCL